MFGTRKNKEPTLSAHHESTNSWAVEILQIYHIPLLPSIKQGWHCIETFSSERKAVQRAEELGTSCQVRVRELSEKEKHDE